MNGAAQETEDSEGGTFIGSTLINEWNVIPWVGQLNGKRAGANQNSCKRMAVAYVYVLGQGVFVFVILGVRYAHVFVVLGPEYLCILFRLECLCDFGPESLYVDYWSRSRNCKMKLHLYGVVH
jgi:hypothetical protein